MISISKRKSIRTSVGHPIGKEIATGPMEGKPMYELHWIGRPKENKSIYGDGPNDPSAYLQTFSATLKIDDGHLI